MKRALLAASASLLCVCVAAGQTASPVAVGWLRYAVPPDPPRYHDMPHTVVLLGGADGTAAPEEQTAADELDRGLGHMVAGTDELLRQFDPRLDSIVLGTTESLRRARLPGWVEKAVPQDGFRIMHVRKGPRHYWVLQGGSPRGEMYAAFRFAALVAEDRQLPEEWEDAPHFPVRALRLEGRLPVESETLAQWGRLLASVGITDVIAPGGSDRGGDGAEDAVSQALRPFGIRVFRDAAQFSAVHGKVREATWPGAPMAGLAMPAFSDGTSPVAEFVLLPGGPRRPALALEAWQRTLRTPENPGGTLDRLLQRGGLAASLPAEAVPELLRQPFLQVSLYAFGRLAWNPAEKADAVVDAWARQTWGDDARIFGVAKRIALESFGGNAESRPPMGLPQLWTADGAPAFAATDRAGTYEINGSGMGVDRGAQLSSYPPDFARDLADPQRWSEQWLLLLHRVPYSHGLAGGDSVVQAFYNAEFASAGVANNAVDAWDAVRELVEPERFQPSHDLLALAARKADIFREVSTERLLRLSGVEDRLGFVGKHPGRTEAEAMTLQGFMADESETASAGRLVRCEAQTCSAETAFSGAENVYRVTVGYFDSGAEGPMELRVNGEVRAAWNAGGSDGKADWRTADRRVTNGIRLKHGDRIEIRGKAALDFVEVTRDPRWN